MKLFGKGDQRKNKKWQSVSGKH